MKKIFFIFIILFITALMSFGHGGRTDKNGGHYNRKTGEYHYHNSGSADSGYNEGVVVMVILGVVIIWIIVYSTSKK